METAYLIAAFAFVVTALIHGLLALSAWQKSTRDETDWTFFFSMLASAFWCVGNAVASAFGTPLEKSPSALGQALSVASYFVLYTIAPTIRHCVVLSQLSMRGWRRWTSLVLNYLGVIPFALLFGYNASPLFLVYIALIIIEVRRTGGLRSRYVRGSGLQPVMRVGLGGTLLLVALPPVLCPLYPNKADLICLIPKFGSLPPALVLAYVVLRYRFMDIVLKRSLLYSLLSGLLLGLYLVGVKYGVQWLFPAGGPHTVALDLFLILVLIFAFQPLKAGLQTGIDRLFFCSCRDLKSAEAQKNFSQAFTHWSDLEALCRSFAEKVTKSLGVTYGTILFSDGTLHGFTPSPQPAAFRGEDGDAIRAVCRVLGQGDSRLIVVEELAEGPLKAACREVGVGLVVTLACREQPGWLLLGEKRSGGPFLSEETFLVEAVCGQVAVAIDNFCLVQAKVALEREVQHREKLVAIGQLAATIAHEIRNPITGAKCLLQQIEENLNGAPEGKEYVQLALEDLERVEQSVSQLLTFARKEEFHFSEQDVTALTQETVHRFATQAQGKGVTVRFQRSASVWAAIDEEKVRRVLLNLLENGSDAVNGNGVVAVSVGAAGPEVEIRVGDNGPGLTPEDQDRIFEPFFTKKEKGTGLGLAIAKKIVEGHGGRIAVVSTPGRGTTFTVVFLRQRPDAKAAA